jgi:AcrR family transcriptional regulator
MLETAGRVFADRGFHEASMDDIAEAAGISKPMLYSYFGSKEGLYFAVVDLAYREIIATIDSAVAEVVAAGGPPDEQLRAGVRAYYRYVGEKRNAFRVLFREMGDPGGQLEQPRRRLRRRVALAIDAILQEWNETLGERASSEALAEAFLGAARGLADWWLDNSQCPVEEIEAQLMSLMLGGLRGLGADLT